MWSFASNAIASFGPKKNSLELTQGCSEFSDDEVCSNTSREEGLECPICWESFNIVENVPYVLWCGHTLCKNCVLGLQSAILSFSSQKIQIPFFISCPWCYLLSFRLVYKGNLRFPRKNFFLLWMVESLNGDRMKSCSTNCGDHQPIWSPTCNGSLRRPPITPRLGQLGSSTSSDDGGRNVERHPFSLPKSLDFFIHFTSKFPLVIIFLLIVFFVIPASAAILALYLIVTLLFAIPSFVILYFTYPTLDWLVREITN